MSAFLEGIGALIGKVTTYIPGRVEKIKNERDRLEKEKDEISKINMDINNLEHRKKAVRLSTVIARIAVINELLKSKASD